MDQSQVENVRLDVCIGSQFSAHSNAQLQAENPCLEDHFASDFCDLSWNLLEHHSFVQDLVEEKVPQAKWTDDSHLGVRFSFAEDGGIRRSNENAIKKAFGGNKQQNFDGPRRGEVL